MFELVSGANFLGEMVEWCGYAVATWTLPAFAFAFFTVCSIGPRAYHHHRCVTVNAAKASLGPGCHDNRKPSALLQGLHAEV